MRAEEAVDRAWDGYVPRITTEKPMQIFIPTSSDIWEYYP